MNPPVYEVVIDHRDPGHHAQMEALRHDLLRWARRHRCTQLERQTIEIRPGVYRLRFFPSGARLPQPQGDRLVLGCHA